MRPPLRSLIGPRGLCSWFAPPFLPRSRLGGAGGPKLALRSRPPGPIGHRRGAARQSHHRLGAVRQSHRHPGAVRQNHHPAGPRSAKAAAGTGCESARRTIFARPRLAHGQAAALKRLRVELLDDLFGLAALEELHERKATRTSGLAIDRHDDMGGFGDGREVGAKVSFAGPVGKVPDEQTDSQGFLVSVAAQILSQNPDKPRLKGPSYMSCNVHGPHEGKVSHDETSSIGGHGRAGAGCRQSACNRTQTSREAERRPSR